MKNSGSLDFPKNHSNSQGPTEEIKLEVLLQCFTGYSINTVSKYTMNGDTTDQKMAKMLKFAKFGFSKSYQFEKRRYKN